MPDYMTIFDDLSPSILPCYGPACPTCHVRTIVDFMLPNCTNPSCGVYAACKCAPNDAPEPYTAQVEQWAFYGGLNSRTAVFCRRCGDELRAP